MFSPSKFASFISILSHAKCVNNQSMKLNGNIFPAITKMKGKAYAPKIYHYLLMTRLACDQLWAHFLCQNYVSVFYHKSRLYSWQIQHFSKSRGWLTRLRQHKTCHETQLQPEQPECHAYPYYWFIWDPKSKQDKVKVTNLKNLPTVQLFHFKTNVTRDTPFEVAWWDV